MNLTKMTCYLLTNNIGLNGFHVIRCGLIWFVLYDNCKQINYAIFIHYVSKAVGMTKATSI